MSGFNFGQTSGGGFNFGANRPATTTTSFGFGTPATATQAGTTFGTAGQPTAFGAATQPGTSFGAAGQLSTGFGAQPAPSFGATTQPAPTFGSTAQTGTAFGTVQPAATFGSPAQTGTAFGTVQPTATFGSTPQTGTAFGTVQPAPTFASTAQSGTSFGTIQPATTFGSTAQAGTAYGSTTFGSNPAGQVSFGATPATSAPTLSFGAPASTNIAQPTFGAPGTSTAPAATGLFGASTTGPTVSFGATTTQPAAQPSLFGAPASTQTTTPAPPTLSFGAASTQAQPAAGLFSTPTTTQTTAPTLNFGSPATTKPSLFGLSTPTSSTTGGLTSGLLTSTTTTAPTLALGGLGTTTSVATSLPARQGFSLATTTSSFSLGGTATPSLGLLSSTASSSTPASTSTTTSVGLGGVDNSAASGGLAGTGASGRQETKTVKEQPIPNEVAQLVENFRNYVKQQKSLSCEVARCSERPLVKVKEDTEALKQLLATTSGGLQRCHTIADKLKSDTAKGLQHVEMAQRTHDTPPGLQYDNTAPLAYFAERVSNFERDIQLFRQEIETAERHVKSQTQAAALSPAELNQALRRLHDSFASLAGRLQTVHTAVEGQKEQYLSLRKYTLNDTTDVFQEVAKAQARATAATGSRQTAACRNTAGPSPFSTLGGQPNLGLLGLGAVSSTFAPANPLGFNRGQSAISCGSEAVGGSAIGTFPSEHTFQLQQPPMGNKRGKR